MSMNVKYKDVSISIPSTGNMVEEEFELVQFKDCYLYILPSDTKLDREMASSEFDRQMLKSHSYINEYDIRFVETMPRMDNHPNLCSAIEEGGYNLVMGLREPGALSKKLYLLSKSTNKTFASDMSSMFKASEQITKESTKDLMLRHVMCSPKSFLKSTEHIWESEHFLNAFFEYRFSDLISDILDGPYGAIGAAQASIVPNCRGGNKTILTHQKKIELQKKFVENVLKLQENENLKDVKKEIKMVLDSLNIRNQDTISYLLSKPQKDIVDFSEYHLPIKIVERSNLKFEVRGYYEIDSEHHTLGHYRLFLIKDGKEEVVQFSRKPSCIVYLLYLIDIINSDMVDTLDFDDDDDLKKRFCKLYVKVYGGGGKEDYSNLSGKGNAKQQTFHLCLEDIRNAIGNTCEILKERQVSPFVLNNSKSHLFIKKEKIIFDKDLLVSVTKT